MHTMNNDYDSLRYHETIIPDEVVDEGDDDDDDDDDEFSAHSETFLLYPAEVSSENSHLFDENNHRYRNDEALLPTHYTTFPPDALQVIRLMKGNDMCMDCGGCDGVEDSNGDSNHSAPMFASVSYGTLLCRDCAFRHVEQSQSTSVIKCLLDDEWSFLDILSLLEGGNHAYVEYYSASTSQPFTRPGLTTDAQLSTRYQGKIPAAYRKALQEKVAAVNAVHQDMMKLLVGFGSQLVMTSSEQGLYDSSSIHQMRDKTNNDTASCFGNGILEWYSHDSSNHDGSDDDDGQGAFGENDSLHLPNRQNDDRGAFGERDSIHIHRDQYVARMSRRDSTDTCPSFDSGSRRGSLDSFSCSTPNSSSYPPPLDGMSTMGGAAPSMPTIHGGRVSNHDHYPRRARRRRRSSAATTLSETMMSSPPRASSSSQFKEPASSGNTVPLGSELQKNSFHSTAA